MVATYTPRITNAYRFSIAPMLDCTDRHFRVIFRQVSRRSLLYTEMIVAKALQHQKGRRLLDFDEIEHPISLQVGGDNPKELADAAKLAEDWGYDEINLNLGCPSPRVQSGNFGACLMATPNQVAKCIEAMKNATQIPVTIKHRTGIDNFDSEEFLFSFVDQIAKAGADRFAIHARKAWLEGLNPKQNRTIPPLEYLKVKKLKLKRPELKIEFNGGLHTPEECVKTLKIFDGAMVGRSAYSNPMLWQEMDSLIYGEDYFPVKASQVIQNLIPYAQKHLDNEGRLWDISKHLLQLVQAVPGARAWRHNLSTKAQKSSAKLIILEKAAQQLEEVGL
ncbi:tRNA dihydrouridine(20/20a) synthase DusA [Prochlorococcus marinus]|uniref:tRNA-dihydrouridine(20/20a) synthase n=1 Tax=Prochlorococcus marinus (strain MIT 9211) TaxID=93059 RepID=A9B9L2_PROM4|nr:tRNA dihydrouridine(20/20a) synthase DusA [Prochlorococcus marinus]ABX07945.1 tRNA-dihydrouridine synthase [Prochlorococcus marinus str. MIT 9211]